MSSILPPPPAIQKCPKFDFSPCDSYSFFLISNVLYIQEKINGRFDISANMTFKGVIFTPHPHGSVCE
jgi:hypothetical protein